MIFYIWWCLWLKAMERGLCRGSAMAAVASMARPGECDYSALEGCFLPRGTTQKEKAESGPRVADTCTSHLPSASRLSNLAGPFSSTSIAFSSGARTAGEAGFRLPSRCCGQPRLPVVVGLGDPRIRDRVGGTREQVRRSRVGGRAQRY